MKKVSALLAVALLLIPASTFAFSIQCHDALFGYSSSGWKPERQAMERERARRKAPVKRVEPPKSLWEQFQEKSKPQSKPRMVKKAKPQPKPSRWANWKFWGNETRGVELATDERTTTYSGAGT